MFVNQFSTFYCGLAGDPIRRKIQNSCWESFHFEYHKAERK